MLILNALLACGSPVPDTFEALGAKEPEPLKDLTITASDGKSYSLLMELPGGYPPEIHTSPCADEVIIEAWGYPHDIRRNTFTWSLDDRYVEVAPLDSRGLLQDFSKYLGGCVVVLRKRW